MSLKQTGKRDRIWAISRLSYTNRSDWLKICKMHFSFTVTICWLAKLEIERSKVWLTVIGSDLNLKRFLKGQVSINSQCNTDYQTFTFIFRKIIFKFFIPSGKINFSLKTDWNYHFETMIAKITVLCNVETIFSDITSLDLIKFKCFKLTGDSYELIIAKCDWYYA